MFNLYFITWSDCCSQEISYNMQQKGNKMHPCLTFLVDLWVKKGRIKVAIQK